MSKRPGIWQDTFIQLGPDPRSDMYDHGILFGARSNMLPGLPVDGLKRKPISIKEQSYTNYCSAFATSAAAEYHEGVELSAEFQTAAIGEIAGARIVNGATVKQAMKAATEIGFLPQTLSPFKFERDGFEKPADLANYSLELQAKAFPQRQKGYFKVSRGYADDMRDFDMIRLNLWLGRTTNTPIIAAGYWYDNFNYPDSYGRVSMPTGKPIANHMYLIIDWCNIFGEPHLVCQLSSGRDFGVDGIIFMPADVVDFIWKDKAFLFGNGLHMLRDLTPSLWSRIMELLNPSPKTEPKVIAKSARERLFERAQKSIGQDASPNDKAPDEVGCAETVNEIHKAEFGFEIGGDVSTARMFKALVAHPDFRDVSSETWLPGDVIISPTGSSKKKGAVGHCAIVDENGRIMSNDSKTGKWQSNYTYESWTRYFKTKNGFPIYVFRRM